MSDLFLDATAAEISDRIRTAATVATGEPVVVHVGEEAYGFRNIGVELPKARRSADETRRLRLRLSEAVAQLRVTLAPHALAPKVSGHVQGQVQVRFIERVPPVAAHLHNPAVRSAVGERAAGALGEEHEAPRRAASSPMSR